MIRVELLLEGQPPSHLLGLSAHISQVLYGELEGDLTVKRIEVEEYEL